jgi:hypothetical protein
MNAEQFKAWLRGESVEGFLSQSEIDAGALQPNRYTRSTKGDDLLILTGELAGSSLSDLSDGDLAALAYNVNSEYDADLRDAARVMVEKRRGSHEEED